jgi:hypothetical protein
MPSFAEASATIGVLTPPGWSEFARLLEHVGDEHPCSLSGEEPCLRRTLPARPPGDQGRLAFEPVHPHLLSGLESRQEPRIAGIPLRRGDPGQTITLSTDFGESSFRETPNRLDAVLCLPG